MNPKQTPLYFVVLITPLLLAGKVSGQFINKNIESGRPLFTYGDTLAIRNQLKQTSRFFNRFPDSAYVIYKSLLAQSQNAGYQNGIVLSSLYTGKIDVIRGDYKKALQAFSFALQNCDTIRHRNDLAIIYSDIGSVFNIQGKFTDALQAFYKALYFSENLGYYNNIANVLAQLKQYDKAIQYMDAAIPFARAKKEYNLLSILYINKGMCYYELRDYAKSEQYTGRGVRIAKQHQLYRILNSGLLNMGLIYMSTGRSQKALGTLREAMALYQKPGMTLKEQNETISITGDLYLQLKNYRSAERYFLLAWKNADILPKERLYILQKLTELYATTGRYHKAYAMQQQYIALNDSMKGREVAFQVSELETKYRTAAKDREIERQRVRIATGKQQIAEKNNLILSIGLGSSLIILLLSWRYMYVRQKNRKLKSEQEIRQLKARIEGEEQERSRIAHDLHDSVNSRLAATQSYLLSVQQVHPYLSHSADFKQVKKMLVETSAEVRQVAHNLAPDDLLLKGLPLTVKEFCNHIFALKDLNAEVQVYGDFDDLNAALSLSIYRVIQELLHNVVKHAQATEVTVLLNRLDAEVSLIVEDNGKGIPGEVLQQHKYAGIGLSGLQERVKAQNGTLQIDSRPGGGTMINIIFPVKASSGKTA